MGDLLLQVLFYAEMAANEGHFTIAEVLEALNRKLVRRHPHVFGEEASRAAGNEAVVDAMTKAQAVTAPSIWVAQAISRGLLVSPEVVYHGVDAEEWLPEKAGHSTYVFWNKARHDPVSDCSHMQLLARRMPKQQFVSTLRVEDPNVKIVGVRPVGELRPILQDAAVYLATARETFGIGTLEALAAGVPVAGWDYGGQSEIIIPGETGYLAPFEDWDALAECVNKCTAERDRLSPNCITDARTRWAWPDKIAEPAHAGKVGDEFKARAIPGEKHRAA